MVTGCSLAQIIIYLGLNGISLTKTTFFYLYIMDSNPCLYSGIMNSGQIIGRTDDTLITNLPAAFSIEWSFRQDQFSLLTGFNPFNLPAILDNCQYLCVLIQMLITGKLHPVLIQEASKEPLFL